MRRQYSGQYMELINMIGVYKIEYANGIYIGSSTDITKRWRLHRSMLRRNKHHSSLLQRAYNKYGLEAFSFEVICECTVEETLEIEQRWIDYYSSLGYRILNTASVVTKASLGYRHTEESKKLFSEQKTNNQNAVKSKGYWFLDPNGNEIHVINLNMFCKENNLNTAAMWLVHKGTKKSYKGYTRLLK